MACTHFIASFRGELMTKPGSGLRLKILKLSLLPNRIFYDPYDSLWLSSFGLLSWGYPKLAGWLICNGKSQSKIDDDWGVPRHDETETTICWLRSYVFGLCCCHPYWNLISFHGVWLQLKIRSSICSIELTRRTECPLFSDKPTSYLGCSTSICIRIGRIPITSLWHCVPTKSVVWSLENGWLANKDRWVRVMMTEFPQIGLANEILANVSTQIQHKSRFLPQNLNAKPMTCVYRIWLVVWTPLKNISQLGWLFPICGKIKNVPNHQPGM